MKKVFIVFILLLIVSLSFSQEYRWYKGNIHTHTNLSDGDELPRKVVRWYQDNGYNFLILSDHNKLTETKYLDSDKSADDFILIPGEEVTGNFEKKPVHMNAINIKKVVPVIKGSSVNDMIQKNTDAIRDAGGIAMLNHPRWRKGVNTEDIQSIKNCDLLEVYNYTAGSNNFAAGGEESTEAMWDKLLSNNMRIWAAATDDTHNYHGDFNSKRANPGRGWVVVKSKDLTSDAITESLKTGNFYASVGVELKDVVITDKEYKIEIAANDPFVNYTTFFIGKDGKILKEDYSTTPSYQFKGDELYVRARVFSASGDFAITQPKFLK